VVAKVMMTYRKKKGSVSNNNIQDFIWTKKR